MTLLVTLAVFAGLNAVILLMFYVATSESPVAARLRGLTMSPAAVATSARRDALAQRPGFLTSVLTAVGQFAFRRDERSLAYQLCTAGLRGQNAVTIFLGARTAISVVPPFLLILPRLISGEPLGDLAWQALIVGIVGHVLVTRWLKKKAENRMRRITENLPDALDLMVICLEAGIGVSAAIARVAQERVEKDDPLCNELEQVTAELKGGRAREEALHDLGVRNGVEDLKSLTALMIQSHKLGASMGATLRSHADLLRTKRRQRAEEAARKLPIKILVPLATCILPPLFVIILGPAILRLGGLVDTLGSR